MHASYTVMGKIGVSCLFSQSIHGGRYEGLMYGKNSEFWLGVFWYRYFKKG